MPLRTTLGILTLALLAHQTLAAPTGKKRYENPKPAPGFHLSDPRSNTHSLFSRHSGVARSSARHRRRSLADTRYVRY